MRQQHKKKTSQSFLRCLVDDTILTRNFPEIEAWVSQGLLVLIVPLYTLERLHVLKKDSSQIGLNARKAVKFLDRFTSSRGDLAHDPVTLQGPDDQYPTWAEVEAHYKNEALKADDFTTTENRLPALDAKQENNGELVIKSNNANTGALSQLLLDRLNFAKDPTVASPASTPPLSPSSSGPQSSKTSPEVKSATIIRHDKVPVPSALMPLLNPVVWYMHEKTANSADKFFLLTNSADTIHLARDFAIPTKNIHQLRSALGMDDAAVKAEDNSNQESAKSVSESEPKTLFSYDDVDSDEDEEVVFKPRGRGSNPNSVNGRGHGPNRGRGRGKDFRTPRTSFSTPAQPAPAKPQIPIEEIDPDSFDRGGFSRGSTPLANVGNHTHGSYNNPRGFSQRGVNGQGGRGGNYARGAARGGDRGSARGKGRLFVP